MKSVNNLFKKRKSKIRTAAKILIPVAGIIAAKQLWDKKDSLISDDVRLKVLEKTEELQEKVQKFHDFLQRPLNETVEENPPIEEVLGEESNENNEETTEENMEESKENNKEIIAEAEESSEESENH